MSTQRSSTPLRSLPILEVNVPAACARLAGSGRFQAMIMLVIVANAAVLGVETYPGMAEDHGATLDRLNGIFLSIFVVELGVRLIAYGRHPGKFFGDGWNVFDLLVVLAGLTPGLGNNATLLRVVRVLRVARLIAVVKDLRVIVRGLSRSVAPMLGVVVLTVVLMYIYAIAGWAIFGEDLPDRWGTAGLSMLTVFELLTLEGWNGIFEEARPVSVWAVPYFVSFILIGTFVVLNIVIAVVINSVEEARRLELQGESRAVAAGAERSPELADRIATLRVALDELEGHLEQAAASDGSVSSAQSSGIGMHSH